ncbi:MAG: hypothetical protein AAGK66_04030 [Pseudomonadota bacterium]
MSIFSKMKAGVLALGLVGLAACGSGVDRTAAMEAELIQLAEQGDQAGRLFVSLKEHRPELYAEFLSVANEELNRLQSAKRAGFKAGERMRPKLMMELSEAVSSASDENVAEMIKLAGRTYRMLGAQDPQECYRNLSGEAPKDMSLYDQNLLDQEVELMISIFEEGRVSGARAANQAEINAWIMPIARTQPDLIEGLGLLGRKRVSDSQAKQACTSMTKLMNNLQRKSVERRAVLFRGLLKLAEQQSVG